MNMAEVQRYSFAGVQRDDDDYADVVKDDSGDWVQASDYEALEARLAAVAHERDCARASLERSIKLLVGIHALLYPARITTPDGRTMVFRPNAPNPHEVLQALSDRIRALPNELADIDAERAVPERIPARGGE